MFLSPVLLFLLFQGCGLNDYPYLYAPEVSALFDGSSRQFKIYNRSDNDPDIFQGYELYYKFYKTGNFTVENTNDQKNLFSVEEPEPSDLANLGFKKINTVSDIKLKTPLPMIPIDSGDRDDSFEITIDFSTITSSNGVPFVDYNNINLYRTAVDVPDERYKSFFYEDMSTSDLDVPGADVTISLFVFSYGKYDRVYNIYSKPVWLGYINYGTGTFP
ncbi:MAG: hypothetical protein RBT69_06835 [Spirochaetia bacterium]|nr:hypothetical protein [Spirochaetia bacterium]